MNHILFYHLRLSPFLVHIIHIIQTNQKAVDETTRLKQVEYQSSIYINMLIEILSQESLEEQGPIIQNAAIYLH